MSKWHPPKFIQPLKTYDIFGFFFIYNDSLRESSEEKIGLFEVTNFYRKIKRIERCFNKSLNILFCENINVPKVPYELVISRLISLNDTKAYTLAKTIEKFYDLQKNFLNYMKYNNDQNSSVLFEDLKDMKEKSIVHNIAIEEIENSLIQDPLFIDRNEIKEYEEFLDKHNNFLKDNLDLVFYEVRYKATTENDSYYTTQHYYSEKYGRLICPIDDYYLNVLFKEGFPNAIKCNGGYCETANQYLFHLYESFRSNLGLHESQDYPKKKNVQIFEALDEITVPVKMDLQLEIFKGKKFIEIIKRSIFTISKQDEDFLLSEDRKEKFCEKIKQKNFLQTNLKSVESSNNLGQIIRENEFLSLYYPKILPKNKVLKNQDRVCQYKLI